MIRISRFKVVLNGLTGVDKCYLFGLKCQQVVAIFLQMKGFFLCVTR